MARSFKRNPQLSAIAEPNVTPLIDLAFSLLIIFMITTPLLEQTIPLDLPTQTAAPPRVQEEMRHEQIYIVGSRQYLWKEETINYEQLSGALRELARQSNPPILHIRADRTLPYQEVVTLLDLISQNNLSKISLDTAIGN
jgi:biopolymer transport protein ExbD